MEYFKVVRRELNGEHEERFIMHPERLNADLAVAMLPTHKHLPVASNIQLARIHLPNIFRTRLKDIRYLAAKGISGKQRTREPKWSNEVVKAQQEKEKRLK